MKVVLSEGTYSLPSSYRTKIKKAAKELEISQSELIRRVIDEYLSKLGLEVVRKKEGG